MGNAGVISSTVCRIVIAMIVSTTMVITIATIMIAKTVTIKGCLHLNTPCTFAAARYTNVHGGYEEPPPVQGFRFGIWIP